MLACLYKNLASETWFSDHVYLVERPDNEESVSKARAVITSSELVVSMKKVRKEC
jgi:predicted metal-dependent HD superfamily phosphohydrolase